jgi:sugar phosphate isomerase/epimerase
VKLGLGSYACAWNIGVPGCEPAVRLDACGLIQRAASLGLSLVQIADNIPLERCTEGELRTIRAAAGDAGVSLELGTRGIQPDHLRRFLELCNLFESSILRVIIDTPSERPAPGQVVETLLQVMPDIAAASVVLAIENHDRFDARTFAWIVDQVGGQHAGICLDTVNSFGALEGPAVVIETLVPYIVNLHLKDFVIHRHPSMMGFEITGAPAGQGRLDIPGLLATIRASGRDPNAILELWPPREPDIEATIAREREWADESVRYLRTLISE